VRDSCLRPRDSPGLLPANGVATDVEGYRDESRREVRAVNHTVSGSKVEKPPAPAQPLCLQRLSSFRGRRGRWTTSAPFAVTVGPPAGRTVPKFEKAERRLQRDSHQGAGRSRWAGRRWAERLHQVNADRRCWGYCHGRKRSTNDQIGRSQRSASDWAKPFRQRVILGLILAIRPTPK